jgi:hypothetical protein
VRDKHSEGRGPSASAGRGEFVGAALEAATTNATKIVRRLDQQIGVSTSTVREICLDDLPLFPYQMHLSQPFSKDRIGRRYALVKECGALMKEIPGVLNVTWLIDEAHFHLQGYTNKQNFRFWVLENPKLTVANPPHLEGVAVWCALSSV